jgi:hypothetical protein
MGDRPGRRLTVRWMWAAASIVVAGVVSTGCSGAGDGSPHVAVVGDSITGLDHGEISSVLDPPYAVDFYYQNGMRIDQMLPRLRDGLAARGPGVAVIVNLGTNDALQGGRNVDPQRSWGQLLMITKDVPCVVLTTVNSISDAYARGKVASTLNERMMALAAADPGRYKIVDWNRFLISLDDRQRATYLQADLVHETTAGAWWIADAYRSALDTCGTSAQPAPPQEPAS